MKSGIRHFARDKSLIVQDKWISNHAERDVRRGVLRRKTKKRKCYPQEIPEDKMLITFCPQMYHLLWIKFFLISAHLPTLSKKPITGVGVKSNENAEPLENTGLKRRPHHIIRRCLVHIIIEPIRIQIICRSPPGEQWFVRRVITSIVILRQFYRQSL